MAFLQTAHRLSTLVPLSTCTRCCCNALVGDERLPTYCKARQFDSVSTGVIDYSLCTFLTNFAWQLAPDIILLS